MKRIKFLAIVIIILISVFTLSACESDISGTYSIRSADPTLSSDGISIELYDDGSGIVICDGDITYIEYDNERIWEAGYEITAVPYSYDNGTITVTGSGVTLV